jgi:hypothetical protein
MKQTFSLLTVLLLTVTACAQTGTLYPANKQAEKAGVLVLQYTAYGSGGGPMQITMPSGEVLKGEYRVVDNSAFGFDSSSTTASGSAVSTGHATAYGSNGVASATSTGTAYGTAHATTNSWSQTLPGSRNGVCAFVGDKGTNGHCEFFVNRFTGFGGGGCTLSNGAEYNLMF